MPEVFQAFPSNPAIPPAIYSYQNGHSHLTDDVGRKWKFMKNKTTDIDDDLEIKGWFDNLNDNSTRPETIGDSLLYNGKF